MKKSRWPRCWKVLGLDPDLANDPRGNRETLREIVELVFQNKAYHTARRGGSDEAMVELSAARAEVLAQLDRQWGSS